MDPLFNYIKNKYRTGGTSCQLVHLHSIDLTQSIGKNKNEMPFIQMFNSGYRVTNDTIDWLKWSGCVAVDIDSYKSDEGNTLTPEEVETMENRVISYLSMRYYDNFYAEQRSFSGKAFHFFFFFNIPDKDKCERTFKICANAAAIAVQDAFTSCNYNNIIDEKDVVDDCAKRMVQGMFITDKPFKYNNSTHSDEDGINYKWKYVSINGYFDLSQWDEWIEIPEYKPELVTIDTSNVKIATNFKTDITDWSNSNRRRLATILAVIYGDDIQNAFKTYMLCYDNVMSKYIKNHTREEIEHFFMDHYPRIKAKEYDFSNKMLQFCKDNLGIKFTKQFAPEILDKIHYDDIITLKDDEYISKVFDKVINNYHGLTHITAGCGLGKTYAAKSLSKYENYKDDPIAFLLSGIAAPSVRICFVTPMTSINSDNFDGIDGWDVVDGNHINANAAEHIKYSKNSVCTTWTSFLAFNMSEINFDVFIFDEIHSIFLYDYRTEIKCLIERIKYLDGNGKKVIMMTGTPGIEINEFDKKTDDLGNITSGHLYKIKIIKPTPIVEADMVFYNNDYRGYIIKDAKEFLDEDENNVVAFFSDKANSNMQDKFKECGLEVDTLYNKRNQIDIDLVNKNHMFKGRVMLCSVYGQAGININTGNKKIRIYIMNTCGMSAIQYANRIRNKEMIDKIVIPYKNELISNSIASINYRINTDDVYKRLEDKNNYERYDQVKEEIIAVMKKSLINLSFGLHSYYTKYNTGTSKWEIDDEDYRIYTMIKRNIAYESQTQILYNRLVQADFDVKLIYLANDITDDAKRTNLKLNRFAGSMINLPNECAKLRNGIIRVSTKNKYKFDNIDDLSEDDKKIYDILTKLRKNIDDTDEHNIQQILNYLYNKYDEPLEDIMDRFREMTNKYFEQHNSLKKITIRRWADTADIAGNIKKQYFDGNYYNDWYLAEMVGAHINNIDIDLNDLTARFLSNTLDAIPQTNLDDVIIEAKNKLTELNKSVIESIDFFNELKSANGAIRENQLSDTDKQYVYNYTLQYLETEDELKKTKHKQKEIIIDGVKYDSIESAATQLDKNRRTINRWLKDGKAKYL